MLQSPENEEFEKRLVIDYPEKQFDDDDDTLNNNSNDGNDESMNQQYEAEEFNKAFHEEKVTATEYLMRDRQQMDVEDTFNPEDDTPQAHVLEVAASKENLKDWPRLMIDTTANDLDTDVTDEVCDDSDHIPEYKLEKPEGNFNHIIKSDNLDTSVKGRLHQCTK